MDASVTPRPEKQGMGIALPRSLSVVAGCLLLASLVVLPFFVIGEEPGMGCCGGAMPATHDGAMHYNQMKSFRRGLAAGRAYPRWDENTHAGYGAPTTSFYPPGIYYLTSGLHFLLGDWKRTIIAFHLITMAASGMAIFWYARQSLSRGAAFIAVAVYLFAPYHLINQYQRGAMAEQMSYIWAPLVLLFAERLLAERLSQRSTWLSFGGLSAAFGAFLWSHPPTAYQLLLVFGPGCLWFADRQGNGRRLIMIVAGLAFGSMLAAAYFFPALIEQNLINADQVEKSWPYHASYVFDHNQIIYDHLNNDFIARIDRIWVFNGMALILALTVLAIGSRYLKPQALKTRLIWWSSAGIFALFLMTRFSAPLGKLIPGIEIGVFSWRMLSLTSLAVALLSGIVWQTAVEAKSEGRGGWGGRGGREGGWRIVGGATIAVVLAATILVSALQVIQPMYRAQAFRAIPDHFNFATLPRGVPQELPEMEPARSATGQGRITIDRWDPEIREFKLHFDRDNELQVRTSNFAGWTASIDGRPAAIKTGESGIIVVELPAGDHEVRLEFGDTPVRRWCNRLTALSFVLLMGMLSIGKRGRRNGDAS